jgi:hypothetical protein
MNTGSGESKTATPTSPLSTTKSVALCPVPPGVVTEIGPVVTPTGTTALIVVLLVTTKLAAGVPLNDTADAFVKLVPVIRTVVPGEP